MIPAESGSTAATSTSTATGTTTASTTCGRYRANVASSASTPVTASGRDVSAGGNVVASSKPPLDDVEPERARHVGRRSPADDLEPPGGCGTTDGRAQNSASGTRTSASEAPPNARAETSSEKHRLREHEQCRGEAEQRVGGEHDAHGTRSADQARVEKRHGDP